MAPMDSTRPRCLYQSTNCENPPAVKDNGTLHRLCGFHRDKANETQRRWQSRHKKPPQPTGIAMMRRLSSFERRAISRLLAATRTTQATRPPTAEEVAKICREQQYQRSHQRLVVATATHNEAVGLASSNTDSKTDSAPVPPVVDLTDDEIHALTALVLEYNQTACSPATLDVDPEFIELVESWFDSEECL